MSKKKIQMKKHLLFLILLAACNQIEEKNIPKNELKGNWAFLDGRGNYSEAFFGDTVYFIFNRVYGKMPDYRYFVKEDSLYSNIDKRKMGLNRIAHLMWLNNDKVIFTTEFSRDTLERIVKQEITLENTDFKKDSLKYYEALNNRYENFLISKGIIFKEEMEKFKETGIPPEDVRTNQPN